MRGRARCAVSHSALWPGLAGGPHRETA